MATGGLLRNEWRRVEVPPDGLRIGREPDNDLVIVDEAVSPHHAVVRLRAGGLEVEDLGSTNGTIVNGEKLAGDRRAVESGSRLLIGHEVLRCVLGDEATAESRVAAEEEPRIVPVDGLAFTVGRDPACDRVLDDPNVSRIHAEVVTLGDGAHEVRDLGSANGTRVDGRLVRRARVEPGGTVGIGPFRLTLAGEGISTRDDRCDVRLEANGVSVRARRPNDRRADHAVRRAGRARGGDRPQRRGQDHPRQGDRPRGAHAGGEVLLNGEPVADRLTDVGYLPQDEIVHGELTPREALHCAGRLRLRPT